MAENEFNVKVAEGAAVKRSGEDDPDAPLPKVQKTQAPSPPLVFEAAAEDTEAGVGTEVGAGGNLDTRLVPIAPASKLNALAKAFTGDTVIPCVTSFLENKPSAEDAEAMLDKMGNKEVELIEKESRAQLFIRSQQQALKDGYVNVRTKAEQMRVLIGELAKVQEATQKQNESNEALTSDVEKAQADVNHTVVQRGDFAIASKMLEMYLKNDKEWKEQEAAREQEKAVQEADRQRQKEAAELKKVEDEANLIALRELLEQSTAVQSAIANKMAEMAARNGDGEASSEA